MPGARKAFGEAVSVSIRQEGRVSTGRSTCQTHTTSDQHIARQKPKVAIIGTGRCGTGYSAEYLERAGIPFSHEGYYTTSGPKLRNGRRSYKAVGDASWLAVPFLPDPDVIAVHQLRNPIGVIRSFYNIGFFHKDRYHEHAQFVDFAARYFEFSDDPLRSSMRWYVEWNRKCAEITPNWFAVERMSERFEEIARWIGYEGATKPENVEKTINTRKAAVDESIDEIKNKLADYPEYGELVAMAKRYGYEV